MSVRNLDYLFAPRSVALIGASNRTGSVGQVLAQNLLGQRGGGNGAFAGPIMPVNPKGEAIASVAAYRDVAALPTTPDLAVICTPPDTVPGLIAELGARGTRAAIVISAGFGEMGAEGQKLQQQLLDAAKPHLLRVMGPNCVGLLVPGCHLNASFAHVGAQPGHLAFVTQSGAVLTSVLDWAEGRGIGFSHMVSLGGMADVDFGDMLDYLAADRQVSAILLYVESITHARKFMSAARAAARLKPVIVIKAGRHAAAAKAAASHTGALAGSDAVYDAAFRRAGMLRVTELEELFDAVETLAARVQPVGERLAILTNGGGMGVLATDRLMDESGQLAELSDDTLTALNDCLPRTWSHGNPVDIIGDAPGARYGAATEALLRDRGVDALVVLNCPTAIADSVEAAEAVTGHLRDSHKPVLTSWLGGARAEPSRKLFRAHGIPTYETPGQAINAFSHMVRYQRNQDLLMQTPSTGSDGGNGDREAVAALIDRARTEGREWLNEAEAKQALAAYAIPIVETRTAPDPEKAGAIAAAFDAPVALKIVSRDITHKSDAGGVMLNLEGADAVRASAEAMLTRLRKSHPDAALEGFAVQPMVSQKGASELIVGMSDDATFGPVILFGEGGTAVEIVADKAIGLPPLNDVLARDLIGRTKVMRKLRGYRDVPAADIDGVIGVLIAISQLVADMPAIAELDINPLIASDKGVMALDARIRIHGAAETRDDRLAISPYPAGLSGQISARNGADYSLRPIRPEDEPDLIAMVEQLDPEDARLRFMSSMRRMSHRLAARLTQIDYDREMAFIALDDAGIAGVVRLTADPDNERAEYAVLVRSPLKGTGLGFALMQHIIDHARTRGIKTLFGHVLKENHAMLSLAAELGFMTEPVEGESDQLRVVLDLRNP